MRFTTFVVAVCTAASASLFDSAEASHLHDQQPAVLTQYPGHHFAQAAVEAQGENDDILYATLKEIIYMYDLIPQVLATRGKAIKGAKQKTKGKPYEYCQDNQAAKDKFRDQISNLMIELNVNAAFTLEEISEAVDGFQYVDAPDDPEGAELQKWLAEGTHQKNIGGAIKSLITIVDRGVPADDDAQRATKLTEVLRLVNQLDRGNPFEVWAEAMRKEICARESDNFEALLALSKQDSRGVVKVLKATGVYKASSRNVTGLQPYVSKVVKGKDQPNLDVDFIGSGMSKPKPQSSKPSKPSKDIKMQESDIKGGSQLPE